MGRRCISITHLASAVVPRKAPVAFNWAETSPLVQTATCEEISKNASRTRCNAGAAISRVLGSDGSGLPDRSILTTASPPASSRAEALNSAIPVETEAVPRVWKAKPPVRKCLAPAPRQSGSRTTWKTDKPSGAPAMKSRTNGDPQLRRNEQVTPQDRFTCLSPGQSGAYTFGRSDAAVHLMPNSGSSGHGWRPAIARSGEERP